MQALRQVGGGLFIAIAAILLVIGGISLAIAESTPQAVSQESPVQPAPTLEFFTPVISSQNVITQVVTVPSTITFVSTVTLPAPTACLPPPSGWSRIIIGAGENIYSLAQKYGTSEDALKNANCLASVDLQPGSALYVPPVFSTAVVYLCNPPLGWVNTHVVQPGENLFRIALSYGLTYPQLQNGNCMGSSIAIFAGQRLWVPNISTFTPIASATSFPVFPTATKTPTSPFISTFTASPSATPTFISTASPVPTSTRTLPPGITSTPSLTPFP